MEICGKVDQQTQISTNDMQLDRYDRHLLEVLQQDGRISNQDLADRINLSPSSCLRRLRTLEESGLILGYRALLDAKVLGLTRTRACCIAWSCVVTNSNWRGK